MKASESISEFGKILNAADERVSGICTGKIERYILGFWC